MTHEVRPKTSTGRPQLVFHIGDPKTGTSSIQRALQDRSVTPETREVLPWIKLNARNLASDLVSNDADNRRAKAEQIHTWVQSSNADYAVISSEFFARANPKKLKNTLDRHLPRYSGAARVIAYVRPHASRFLAAFIQRTKTGHYFGDFESFHRDVNRDNPLTLHYSQRFDRWNTAFLGGFTLRPFIRSELRDGDAVTDFFSVLLNDEPFRVSRRIEENIAVTTRSLSGIRHLHQTLKNQGVEATSRAAIGNAMANYFIPMGESHGEKPKLDRSTAERILETYREDAQRLDDAYFDRPLMTSALETCTRGAAEEPIDLKVESYFNSAEIGALETLSDAVAQLIGKSGRAWATHHRTRTRKTVQKPRDIQGRLGHYRAIRDLDSRLSALAEILRG